MLNTATRLAEMGSLPTNRSVQPILSQSSATSILPSPFRQRQLTRSPIESPPLPKKQLKFLEVGRFHAKVSQNPLSCVLPHSRQRDKENRSILKRDSNSQVKAWKGANGISGTSNRRVNFQPNVVVFHFDKEEGKHVRSESQTLNSDPSLDRKNLVALTRLQASDSGASLDSTNAGKKNRPLQKNSPRPSGVNCTPLPTRRPLPRLSQARTTEESSSSCSSSSPASDDGIEFSYIANDDQTMTLRFSRQLGSGVTASDVVVKANTSGNKIRVLGTGTGAPSTTTGNTTTQKHRRSQEINERFELPVRVDSYKILARVDSNGTLFVEAPILPGEYRPRNILFQKKAT